MSVGIIWWGAAGLMCAATLLEWWYDQDIFLFDKNPHLWAKVIISWWWRCNVTTWFYKRQDLKDKYPHGRDFVQDAIINFWPRKIKNWFQSHGVPLKQEPDERIFPVSDDGKDVVWVFERLFSAYPHIFTKLREKVIDIKKNGTRYEIITDKESYTVDKVVLTTGGNAYRHTGSTWDGYAFAQGLGHTITRLWPSLTSFQTEEKNLHALSGISFQDARIITPDHQKFDGPILLTHFGITWPMVFALSAHIPFVEINKTHPLIVKWIPDNKISYDKWMEILHDAAVLSPSKQINTFLRQYFPSRFIEVILEDNKIHSTHPIWRSTKEIFKKLSHTLGHGLELHIIGRRAGDEFVTSGGIPTQEINPKTMESLICPGLYFWWEIMDIDGITWGYNLTSSRATGRLAWESITKRI